MATSYTVLDSGVLLATVQLEILTDAAIALMNALGETESQIIAPSLLHYEIVAVVRKWVYRGLTSPENANAALSTLLHYPVRTVMDEALLRRAYDLANIHNRPAAYDSQYLVVAERYECDFWTTDERLYNAVSSQFPRIFWLGNQRPQNR